MAKVTNVVLAAAQALFETGDTPAGPQYAAMIALAQQAAQDHEHTGAGGPGTGTGDASPVGCLAKGADASKTPTPTVGMVYVATDTTKFYVCFVDNSWTQVYP